MEDVLTVRRRILVAGLGFAVVPAIGVGQTDSGFSSIGNSLLVRTNHFESVQAALAVLKNESPFSEKGFVALINSLRGDVLDPKEVDEIIAMMRAIFHAKAEKEITAAIAAARNAVNRVVENVGNAFIELAQSSYEGVDKLASNASLATYKHTIVRDVSGGGLALKGVSKITSAWQARIAAVLCGGIATSVAAYFVCDA